MRRREFLELAERVGFWSCCAREPFRICLGVALGISRASLLTFFLVRELEKDSQEITLALS